MPRKQHDTKDSEGPSSMDEDEIGATSKKTTIAEIDSDHAYYIERTIGMSFI